MYSAASFSRSLRLHRILNSGGADPSFMDHLYFHCLALPAAFRLRSFFPTAGGFENPSGGTQDLNMSAQDPWNTFKSGPKVEPDSEKEIQVFELVTFFVGNYTDLQENWP